MQTTTNIGLKTYEANDPTDWLGEFNYNMNKIDTAVGTQNQTITLIGADVTTAVNTANTASATASEALQTAGTKASIDDNVASASTTYSSNKINDLIESGTEIDDSVTSLTKTWSSSKINTEVSSANKFPNYNSPTIVANTDTVTSGEISLTYTTTEDCYIYPAYVLATGSNGYIEVKIGQYFKDANTLINHPDSKFVTGRIYKVKANTEITVRILNVSGINPTIFLYKLGIS